MRNVGIMRSSLDVSYYIELQNRLLDEFLHISCHESNFKTYSIKLASLFLDAGSYFDSLAQTFIKCQCDAGLGFKASSEIAKFSDKLTGEPFFTMADYRTLFEKEFEFSKQVLNLNTYGDHFYGNPMDCFRDVSRCHDVAPFETWGKVENPDWWRAFTKVKHDRSVYLEQATLGSTIMAYGAVFITLTFFHEAFLKETAPIEVFRLFTPKYWKFKGRRMASRPVFH